jgi:hypothetical protein
VSVVSKTDEEMKLILPQKSKEMSMKPDRLLRGFTILESILMLGLLTVFSLVVAGVYKKGITKSDEASDPKWLSKGGDESMKTVSPIPVVPILPGRMAEQPGLGGDNLPDGVNRSKNGVRPE